ncbi:ABC transporter permease [Nocardioides marmoriginsengisoli]|uniref:ABC transporter permease n=1 Tax=Nocardioides marmoriginsengisoli TaxID=661483 RepID=A0A3N0CHI8_9ACTN|nr:ABC transporter permease [Nocardioides marmoriginsengisoli]RNL62898.1 ABC transporter permease [Nocardioides marmoriginsengisoli]
MTARKGINLGLDRFSGLYIWALFIVVFGMWTPSLFLTQSTMHSVAAQQAIVAILALALLVPMVCGAFDLSVGATVNLATVVTVVLQTERGWGMWPSIIAAVAVGALVGALNGFIVVGLKVDSFIATLGTATVITAVQTIVTGGLQPLPPATEAWNNLTQHKIAGFQIVVLYLVVLAFLTWWVLDHTPAGRYLYAAGGNAEAARLTGVPVGRWTWMSLIWSGALCGFAGVLYASLSGPSLTFGAALLLPAFAAVFLGSTQITPGRFNVWGTLLAIYVLATGVKGLQLVTGEQWINDMFNGVALIAAVAFAGWRQRARLRRPAMFDGADVAPGSPTDPGPSNTAQELAAPSGASARA